MNVPMAWLQLSRERTRFAVGIAGVAFAVILMFMQFGFQSALFDSSTKLHESLQGDVFIVDKRTSALVSTGQFSRRLLAQTRAIPSVASASSVYIAHANCRTTHMSQVRPILVIGVNPAESVLKVSGLNYSKASLQCEDSALFDEASRVEFGPVAAEFTAGGSPKLELASRKLRVSGVFKLGVSFGADGNVIVSDTTFLKVFPNRQAGSIDIGVVRLQPHADVASTCAQLKSILPNSVYVFSKAAFVRFEQSYWRSSTAIGFIFRIGVILGVVVGAVIVYQILYAEINDHLPAYATLRAIGYPTSYLQDVVFHQAIILSVAGFVPGIVASLFLYHQTSAATGLPLSMDLARTTLVMCLSLVMCCGSGAIATSRLRNADPADAFSGST